MVGSHTFKVSRVVTQEDSLGQVPTLLKIFATILFPFKGSSAFRFVVHRSGLIFKPSALSLLPFIPDLV